VKSDRLLKRVGWVSVVVVLVLVARALGALEQETQHFTLAFAPGQTFVLANSNGPVEIAGSADGEIHIEAVKKRNDTLLGPWLGGAGALDAVEVRVQEEATGIRAETVVLRAGEARGVSVGYTVRLPRRAGLEISTQNGAVTIRDIEGQVRAASQNGALKVSQLVGGLTAKTSNGSIEATEVAGRVTATTSNGAIRVRHPLELSLDEEIFCETSNGTISLALGAGSGFELDARTSNGRIGCDFAHERLAAPRNQLRTRVGNGGPKVTLSTSNGTIQVSAL